MKHRLVSVFAGLLLLTFAAFLGRSLPSYKMAKPDPYQQLIGRPLPDFTLTDQHGSPVTREVMRGKVWVANLMFASCSTVCLTLGKHLSALDAKIQALPEVRIVSLSVAPEADTPDVLRAYAQKWSASQQWLFLTGERAQIQQLATGGFCLSAGTDEVLTHSDKLVVVDRTGTVRGYFDGTDIRASEAVLTLLKTLHSEPFPHFPQNQTKNEINK
jgi:protein SCO1